METELNSKVQVQLHGKESIKLDRFDGTNYTRWQDRMTWLLLSMNLHYLLDPALQPIADPKPTDSEEIKKKIAADKAKRETDEMLCRGYILNALTDRLYDVYRNYKMPKEV